MNNSDVLLRPTSKACFTHEESTLINLGVKVYRYVPLNYLAK